LTTIAVATPGAARRRPAPTTPARLALLGLGQVGTAVARRLLDPRAPGAGRFRLAAALVRDPAKPRGVRLPPDVVPVSDVACVIARRPAVIVEALGGVEPAAAIAWGALNARVPVVTANKSLLAARGAELLALAAATGTPLLYEASVLAGVPCLGPLASRASAASVTRVEGVLNGTSNFILTAMRERSLDRAAALADAQRLGYAEPNPQADLHGIDSAEKLAVILLHLGWGAAPVDGVERSGLDVVDDDDLRDAAQFGGTIKPVAFAERRGEAVSAFVGPAFVPLRHPLARIDGVENALRLHGASGVVVHAGPGAGPEATAATLLDDAAEACAGRTFVPPAPRTARVAIDGPVTPWFVRLSAPRLRPSEDLARLLGRCGIWLRRTSEPRSVGGREQLRVLTHPVGRERLERGLETLAAAAACEAAALRVLED
jgi:homoserine dehydrogenase